MLWFWWGRSILSFFLCDYKVTEMYSFRSWFISDFAGYWGWICSLTFNKSVESNQVFLELTSKLYFSVCKLSFSRVCCPITTHIEALGANKMFENCTSCPIEFWWGQGPLQAEPINNLLTLHPLSFSLSSGSFVKVTSISSYFLHKYINTHAFTHT